MGFPFRLSPSGAFVDQFGQGKNVIDKKILLSCGDLEGEDIQLKGHWHMTTWSDPTQQLPCSCEHGILIQNHTTGFYLNLHHLPPQGLGCFMYLQHRTESRCNRVSPITQPCAALAHTSWTRASRET